MENPFDELNHKLQQIQDDLEAMKTEAAKVIPRREVFPLIPAAEYCEVQLGTLRKAKHKIGYYKRGGRIYFKIDDLNAWLTKYKVDAITREQFNPKVARAAETEFTTNSETL